MNVKRGIAFAALTMTMAACGAASGPQPIATINPNITSEVVPSVAFESEARAVGPITFIEFYAQW
jgi:hypothetical protein